MDQITLTNLKQTAEILGVSPKTVYYWVSRREIPFLKIGRHLRFQVPEVIAFFKTKSSPPKSLANQCKSL